MSGATPSPSLLEDLRELGLDVLGELRAERLDEHLDARLPDVVAPAVFVVDAQDGLEVGEQLRPRQELARDRADDRRAAHAAADAHLEAQLAGRVAHDLQADVVPGGRSAVFAAAVDGDLELARQRGELRVKARPLAHDFAERPRIGDLVGGDAGEAVGGDVADAVAAGLDAVHADLGELVHHVGGALERDPVELDVGARREVAVAAVVGARDVRERAQLRRRQRAVRNRDARHRRVALHVPAVLAPHVAEVVAAQRAGEVTLQLVAELARAGADEVAVEVVVLVHGRQARSRECTDGTPSRE